MDPKHTLKHYKDVTYARIQHHKSSLSYFRSINNAMTMVSVVLVSFTGVSTNVTAVTGSDDKITKIIFSILLYLSLVTTGFKKILKLDKKVEQHESSVQRYNVFYENVMEYSQERRRVDEFLIKNFQMIDITSPDIPDFIKKNVVVCPETIDEVNIDMTERDNELDFELRRMSGR
jgi:hypothetical protein